jgi:hypothetical protein
MVNWNAPLILPLKFPLRTKDPDCDPPEVKHGVDVVKVRFVPVTVAVPLLCVSDVVKAKAGVPSLFVSVAVQLPVTVFEVLELPPQARRIRPAAITIAIPNCFIGTPSSLQTQGALESRAQRTKRRESPLWEMYGIERSSGECGINELTRKKNAQPSG